MTAYDDEVRASTSTWRILRQLFGYVRPHAQYAVLTVLFGVLGFGLSYVYPWIIGAVVDVLAAPGAVPTVHQRWLTIFRFTELASASASSRRNARGPSSRASFTTYTKRRL